MTWSIKGGAADNELLITASLANWKTSFMSATNLTKHRGYARRNGGDGAADAYVQYVATLEVGAAAEQHKPGSFDWLQARKPWYALPYYDPAKRGQTIIDGTAVLVFRNKADALLFKLTFA